MLDERIEHAGRVAAAADAGDDHIRQPAELLARLLDRFAADDRLKIADDPRERMRADDRAEDVVRRFDARHPVAHGFVDGVAERARAAGDRPHFGAQQLHAEHVRRLAADVFFAHVDDAIEAEVGTGGGGGDAVLAGAGFGDHALLAHPQREQRLAERVVDFVRAGVIEVFALEPDLRAAALLAEPLGMIERRRPADVVLQQRRQLGLKCGILAGFVVLDGQFIERANERFGHVASAKCAEAAGGIGNLCALACSHALSSRLILDCKPRSNQVAKLFTTEDTEDTEKKRQGILTANGR